MKFTTSRTLIYLLSILALSSCQQSTMKSEHLVIGLELGWAFLENNVDDGSTSAVFTLENKTGDLLSDEGWSLYYSQMGKGPVKGSVEGPVGMEHVNGDLHRIFPKPGFSLADGESLQIHYRQPRWQIKNSSSPSGPFFVRNSDGGAEVYKLSAYEALPLKDLDKVFPDGSGRRSPDAAWFYEKNEGVSLLEDLKPQPVPRPVHSTLCKAEVELDLSGIRYQTGLENEANYLAEMLNSLLGIDLASSTESEEAGIELLLEEDAECASEGYDLDITEEGHVMIKASNARGVFYGINSLLGMLPVEMQSDANTVIALPVCHIKDAPAFEYRGLHLDLARNFISPEAIRKLIRIMSYYKMNKLHLHLVDDEGWRLEIPSVPELTEVGAFRGFSPPQADDESAAGVKMIPAYGSGPFPHDEGNHGTGYISRNTFIELIQYADKHHVEVIPEINFPGHARAAIAATEARYKRLLNEGKTEEEAAWYRLIDPEDASIYNSAQNFNDNIACVCSEGLYRLFETVVDDILEMYKDAGLTLSVLHTGGDEVPHGSWTGSPICLDFVEEHPEIGGVENLQAYCGARLYEILEQRGLIMGGWEEVAMKKNAEGTWVPNSDFTSKQILPYVWNSILYQLDLGYRLANTGFPVILCNVTNFYFDMAYTPHPEDPGLYWGAFIGTRENFEMSPFNVYQTTFHGIWENSYDPEVDFKGKVHLKAEAKENILGLQAELWSETIHGSEALESYYLPKLIGFAERAWVGEADWSKVDDADERLKAMHTDWNVFANLIGQREFPRLDKVFGGFNYRLPPPGARIVDGKLHANVPFPGLEIRYTTDGNDPNTGSSLYEGPLAVEGEIRLCTFDQRGRSSLVTQL